MVCTVAVFPGTAETRRVTQAAIFGDFTQARNQTIFPGLHVRL
jgi:hypothetical protein